MREATFQRTSRETKIDATLRIDGRGETSIHTGIGFFDHMLTAWALNARFDLTLAVEGDLEVSMHHTVEDTGIVLGRVFADAVGDKAGIVRYGAAYVPMDETLGRVALDLSGRAYAHLEVPWQPVLGPVGFDYALTSEFFWGFARGAALTVHADVIRGRNNHHMCESLFKAFGRALDAATLRDERLGGALPSTKGSFDG